MISTATLLILPGTTASLDLIAVTDTMSVMQIWVLLLGKGAPAALDRRPSIVSRTVAGNVSWLTTVVTQADTGSLATRAVAL